MESKKVEFEENANTIMKDKTEAFKIATDIKELDKITTYINSITSNKKQEIVKKSVFNNKMNAIEKFAVRDLFIVYLSATCFNI